MITYRPIWRGPIQGRAVNLCRQFYPRLASFEEMGDLLQDAYLVFSRCRTRFMEGGSPQLFMAFFSVSLYNKLCSMIKKAPRYILLDASDLSDRYDAASVDAHAGYLLCVLRELPSELTDLLGSFSSALPHDVTREMEKRLRKIQRRGFLMRGLARPQQQAA